MAFEQKNWLNQAEDGTIPDGALPLSAEELDRIERGIAGSLQKDGGTMTGDLILNGIPVSDNQAANKKYVDTNILHFVGETNLKDEDIQYNYFYLPEDIDLDRYEVFFSDLGLRLDSYEPKGIVHYLPKDRKVVLSGESLHTYTSIILESDLKRIVFYYNYSGSYINTFDLFLVPMASAMTLTRRETEL